ncbi:MAG: hypothetical protein ACKVZJ_10445 [Phycisphaerales bacterium]
MRHPNPTPRAAMMAPLAASLTAAALLSACAVDNDRLTLGDARGDDAVLSVIEPGTPLTPAAAPSVTGTDRGHWPETLAPVPMDRALNHGFTVNTRRWSNPRHAGRFPTAEQAVTIHTGECAWSGTNTWERLPAPATEPTP